MATLAPESVHCVITSPPYAFLRDYKVEGQIGLEATVDEYLANLMDVFTQVWRVLRSDGTLWLNMGDSYAGSWGAQSRPNGNDVKSNLEGGGRLSARQIAAHPKGNHTGSAKNMPPGVKPKDLYGLPWMVAFALRNAGWYLRSDIIWAKGNPMPESCQDRPTRSHEYLFLLSKAPRYYYDATAIREPPKEYLRAVPTGWDTTKGNGGHGTIHREGRANKQRGHGRRHDGFNDLWDGMSKDEQQHLGANKRDVWTIATQGFPGAHFATFPPPLVEPCILAGTSEAGVCADCGAPRKRIVSVGYVNPGNRSTNGPRSIENKRITAGYSNRLERTTETLGWEPGCECGAETIPATVLDPFSGSGTTALVARRLGRSCIGIDLNPDYVEMAHKRIGSMPDSLPFDQALMEQPV